MMMALQSPDQVDSDVAVTAASGLQLPLAGLASPIANLPTVFPAQQRDESMQPALKLLFAASSASESFVNSLGTHGFDVATCTSLQEAHSRLAADPQAYDVAVVDLGSPEMGDISSFTELLQAFPRLPAVVLVDEAHDDFALVAFKAGAQDVLVKQQCQPDTLARAIRNAHLRSRLRESLIEDEQQLRLSIEEIADTQASVLDSLPAHIALLDRDGKILAVNDAWKRFASANVLGAEDFGVGANYLEICDRSHGICADEAATAAQGIRDVLAGRQSEFAIEYPCHSPSEQRWFRLMATPVKGDGAPRAVVMHVDITARKLIEEQLRASEARLRTILDTEPECVKIVGPDGRVLDINRAGMQMIGQSGQAEIIGNHVSHLIHPDDRAAFIRLHQRCCAGESGRLQFRSDGREGVTRWMETHSAPLRDAEGRITSVLSVTRDITERHHAQAALAEAERRFRLLLSSVGEGVHGIDRDGRIIFENPAALAILGYRESEIVGQFGHMLLHHHRPEGDAYPPDECPIYQTLRDGLTRQVTDEVFFRKNGSSFPVEYTCAAVRDEFGEIAGAVVSFRDISERRRVEAALQSSEQRYRDIVDNLPDLILINRDDRIRYINPAGVRLLRASSADELVGRSVYDIVHPSFRQSVRERIDQMRAKPCSTPGAEEVFVAMDGTLIDVEVVAVSFPSEGKLDIQVIGRDITERKRQQQQNEQLSSRLAELLESISDGFFALDREWRFTYINRQGEQLALVDRQSLLGKTIWEAFPAIVGSRFEIEYRRAVETQQTVEFEEYYPPLKTWSNVRAYPTPDGLAIYFHDVTEARKAQAALQQSEARFREMAENIQEVFYNEDVLDGRTLYVSPSYELVWGRSCESLYRDARSFLEAIHPDDRPIAEAAHQAALSGQNIDVEYRIVRGDNQIHWIRDRTYPIQDANGKVVRVVGAALDITESRNAAEQLRLSEERMRLLADATSDAIWEWDMVSNALWWSEGFETLFGYRRDEVEPTLDSWLNRIHPDDRERVEKGPHRVIENGLDFWADEYRFLCKNGKVAYVLDRGRVIRNSDGTPVRMVGGMTDLTEKKNLEIRLHQSQKMEAIGHLAGGVAHDFNNLLTVINGYSEMLQGRIAAGSKDWTMLAEIREAGERAADLTRQLLAFGRKQMLVPRVIDVNDAVNDIEKMLRRLIGEHIELRVALQANPARVKVDPSQLQQVMMNLVVNARDAMPSGGQLTIETAIVVLDQESQPPSPNGQRTPYVALSVSDSGAGMSKETLAHIFEPFFTTKEIGQGTGLGLSTVFGIVKQSDGFIDVESQVGAGTKFRLLFPAVDEQVSSPQPSCEPVPAGNETILLVEDEAPVRRIGALALASQGYHVIEASNGNEALDMFEQSHASIDLVATDLVMPELSGRPMIEEMRLRKPDLRVLFISGYTDDEVARQGIVDARDAFLQKPFSPIDLASKIREVLDAR